MTLHRYTDARNLVRDADEDRRVPPDFSAQQHDYRAGFNEVDASSGSNPQSPSQSVLFLSAILAAASTVSDPQQPPPHTSPYPAATQAMLYPTPLHGTHAYDSVNLVHNQGDAQPFAQEYRERGRCWCTMNWINNLCVHTQLLQ